MTHELKKIVKAFQAAQSRQLTAVLATVVHLIGSSYRKPGVRMLILEDGTMVGAVSGGCVEKEVYRQSGSVFKTQRPKIMTYDGRYRLGCEGILYILIEPFAPDTVFLNAFKDTLKNRHPFTIKSYYQDQEGEMEGLGSMVHFRGNTLPVHSNCKIDSKLAVLEKEMKPCQKLMIIGTEHDAVQLCGFAALIGWEVSIVATPMEAKELSDFEGSEELSSTHPEALDTNGIDLQTAVVVMTHSYVKDLQYLLRLKDSQPAYLGLLGPAKRREKLLGELMERDPEIALDFVESVHGPAGLNIGAETPQEIAIAIISEIVTVLRKQKPIKLKNKKRGIHD